MSSQVGSWHVAIFPVMTGFKSAVSKDVAASGSGHLTVEARDAWT